ncbi:MAG: fibronectin type III domain-containing protein, partial [Salinispira sp.]
MLPRRQNYENYVIQRGGVTLFAFCSIFIVLIAGCPMPDAPPTMFAPALVAGDGQLTASWAELAAIWNEVNKKTGNAITSYNLRYGEFGSGSWTEINSGITGASHTITELTNGMNYAVQVRAVNTGGAGTWSASSTARPTAPPAAPGTMAAPTLEVENGQLIATWTAPTDNGSSPITGYELRYRTDDDGDWTIIRSGISCASSTGPTEVCHFSFSSYSPYTIHSITADGANYQLQVRAVNAQGTGAWSPSSTATLVTAPAAPGTMAAPTLEA